MTLLAYEVKQLIIETLHLEDISPEDIDTNAPLFVEGLGLDSIDALELGVALKKKYQISINESDDNVQAHFSSVENLVKFIEHHRK